MPTSAGSVLSINTDCRYADQRRGGDDADGSEQQHQQSRVIAQGMAQEGASGH